MESRPSLFDPAELTRNAAYMVGPRVYQLTHVPEGPVRFLILGCHGNGKQSQRDTAALMNETVLSLQKSGEVLPSLILYAGDNLYDYGVTDPAAQAFYDNYHDIYYDEGLTGINSLPGCLLLGNHDENYSELVRQAASLNIVSQGEGRGINQAAHTYLGKSEKKITKKLSLFTKPELPIEKLGQWNMPYLFYSLVLGNTQIFMLNSNSYPKDYLQYVTGQTRNGVNLSDNRTNQAAWLEDVYKTALANGKQIFIVQHHPLAVCGKRSFPAKYDARHYLYQDQINQLNAELKKLNPAHRATQSYNELLALIYQQQNINPQLVLCAHEHFLSWRNDFEKMGYTHLPPQFTAGGGGGKLDARYSYRDHPYVGLNQQQHGFGMVTCDPAHTQTFTLDVFTLSGLKLRFIECSHRAVVETHLDPHVMTLRDNVLSACDTYFSRLREKELHLPPAEGGGVLSWMYGNAAHLVTNTYEHYTQDPMLANENRVAQDIQAYFNQHQLPDYDTALKKLHDFMKQLPSVKSKNLGVPFHTMLQQALHAHHSEDNEDSYEAELNPCK